MDERRCMQWTSADACNGRAALARWLLVYAQPHKGARISTSWPEEDNAGRSAQRITGANARARRSGCQRARGLQPRGLGRGLLFASLGKTQEHAKRHAKCMRRLQIAVSARCAML
eukprot:2348083-Pleurochrysis_carterae.AAC.4